MRILNYSFVDEWRQAVWMADVYYRGTPPSPDLSAAAAAFTPVRKLATARALLRHRGYRGVIEHAWRRARSTSGALLSAGVAHAAGEANRWYLNHRLLRP